MLEEVEGYRNGTQFAEEVLVTLKEQEVALEEEYDFAFYLYVKSEDAAKSSAEAIRKFGLEVEVNESDESENEWLVYATKNLLPTIETLESLGTKFIELAESVGGEFDGWEIVPDFSLDFGMITDYSQVAKDVLTSVQMMHPPQHEYAQVELNQFDDLDEDFYQTRQNEFEVLGFEKIADVENLTLSECGPIRTMIRVMWNPELKITGAFYYIPQIEAGLIDILTLFNDDFVIYTTTTPAIHKIAECPTIKEDNVQDVDEIHVLLKRHIDSVKQKLSNSSKLNPVDVGSYEKMLEAQNLVSKAKHEHLSSIGWVTESYLLGQTGGDEELAKGIYDEIQSILQCEVS